MKVFGIIIFSFFLLNAGCSNKTSVGSLTAGTVNATLSGANILPVSVGVGGACDGDSYINEPCVAITICAPGTTNCQTINNILLDTGSYGLRVFSSAITVPLTQVTTGGKNVAECASFGSGTTWGPVQTAGVGLAMEPVVSMPIQVIQSTYAGTSGKSLCTEQGSSGSDSSPSTAGYNGILGLGLLNQDCGTDCVTDASNGMYYSCTGNTCSGITYALNLQVSNPVSYLPTDNNGVLLVLPNLASAGAYGPAGSLALGIGTQSNNNPAGKTVFAADSTADFNVTFNGATYTGFIDSGSNGLFFVAPPGLSTCPDATSFFCPAGVASYSATNSGLNGATAASPFRIANSDTLFNSPNSGFNDLGGPISNLFDWGLPFFFGRYVFVGLTGAASTAGVGPYWAY